jgi:hypothetical protein
MPLGTAIAGGAVFSSPPPFFTVPEDEEKTPARDE